ncbi:MAG: hypothetical protein HYW86_01955 [Candidatus Roizmanbacteria bacterium]|nr:MAG: hypothetical protein HYW86_01955 [Candidatus Roizmanbacteria bacterium]
MERPIVPNEARTHAFFDRSAADVAEDMAERVYERIEDKVTYREGRAKILQVSTTEGQKQYVIAVAEPYSAANPNRVWKGKRLDEIKASKPGDIEVYGYRAGILPFGTAKGGDNVLIRELRDLETNEQIKSPTAVARVLGLVHGDRGKLTFSGENQLRFERINTPQR